MPSQYSIAHTSYGDYLYGSIPWYKRNSFPFISLNYPNSNEWIELHHDLPPMVNPVDIREFGKYLILLSYSVINSEYGDGTTRVYISSDMGLTWKQLGDSLVMFYPKLFIDDKFITIAGYYSDMYRYPIDEFKNMNRSYLESNNRQIEIHPNPAFDKITIHTASPQEYFTLTIRDIVGRSYQCHILDYNRTRTIVDISPLPSGMYFVTLMYKNRSGSAMFRVTR
jgi:hypothetical protein